MPLDGGWEDGMAGWAVGGVTVLRLLCNALNGGADMLLLGCGVGGAPWSGSVLVRSWSGGTLWYSLGGRSEKAVLGAALTGVGKTFAPAERAEREDDEVYADDIAESLFSGLTTEALAKVDAVCRSSSVWRGRP